VLFRSIKCIKHALRKNKIQPRCVINNNGTCYHTARRECELITSSIPCIFLVWSFGRLLHASTSCCELWAAGFCDTYRIVSCHV